MIRERQLTHDDRIKEQAKQYVCINTKVVNEAEHYHYSDNSFLQYVEDNNSDSLSEVWKIQKEDLQVLKDLILKEINCNRHDNMKYFECGGGLTTRYKLDNEGLITIIASRQEVQFELKELKPYREVYSPKYYKNNMSKTPRKITRGERLDDACAWGISLIRRYLVDNNILPKCILTE